VARCAFSTTIFSEGVVYLANEKRRVKDRFRVFERAVSFGKELPDGKVADKNYVWFSDWQLQNINSNHLLPIDLEAYRQLKNHIAKALVPLLQVWLYATRTEGIFEKRYDELCQMLNIRKYAYASLITRTLGPSLDELAEFGYLADWKIERTSDGDNYKIIFYHGEKFHRDRRARLNRTSASEQKTLPPDAERRKEKMVPLVARSEDGDRRRPQVTTPVDELFLAELVKRGVTQNVARKILSEIKPDQPVVAQLEWGDLQIKQSGGRIANPAGFYVSLISGNVTPPANFETADQRKTREDAERQQEELRRAELELETEYEWYCAQEIDRYISTLDPQEVSAVREAKRQENQAKYQVAWMVDHFSERDTKSELRKRVPLLTLAEFAISRDSRAAHSSPTITEPEVLESMSPESEFWASVGTREMSAPQPMTQPASSENRNSDPDLTPSPSLALAIIPQFAVELLVNSDEGPKLTQDDSTEPLAA
jgi:hypothetical protein